MNLMGACMWRRIDLRQKPNETSLIYFRRNSPHWPDLFFFQISGTWELHLLLLVTFVLVSKPEWIPPLACFLTCVQWVLRFTSGVTPADLLVVSMAAQPFWATYLSKHWWGSNSGWSVQQTGILPLKFLRYTSLHLLFWSLFYNSKLLRTNWR